MHKYINTPQISLLKNKNLIIKKSKYKKIYIYIYLQFFQWL